MNSSVSKSGESIPFALHHAAVLTLARAGAVRFALSEYERYGLDKISDLGDAVLLEDIMSLGGRLYKDLALAHSGSERKDYAAQSSQKYDAAFKKTGGYYSGINAATMALVAGFPNDMVLDRATAILDKLPDPTDLPSEQIYYIEATRAEAHLLLGDRAKASTLLRQAIAHDPLNYLAHATTLKQFAMTAETRNGTSQWVDGTRPPKSVHYSGHMFALEGDGVNGLPFLTDAQVAALEIEISDTIQRNDIGYGYGALAAGSDILIAESLLAEGCELHVVLPVPEKEFFEYSVAPYGPMWERRFKHCLQRANSVLTASRDLPWPCAEVGEFASRVAMGEAIRNTDVLSAGAAQLIIWDGRAGVTGSAFDGQTWQAMDRPQYIITYAEHRDPQMRAASHKDLSTHIILASEEGSERFDDVGAACAAAIANREDNHQLKQGLHIGLDSNGEATAVQAKLLVEHSVPGGILLSKHAADLLALDNSDDFATDSLGQMDDGQEVFALRAKGKA